MSEVPEHAKPWGGLVQGKEVEHHALKETLAGLPAADPIDTQVLPAAVAACVAG